MTSALIKPLADIACIMRIGEDVPQFGLQQAIALASATGAHLSVQISVQQLSTPYSPFWISLPGELVGEMNLKAKARAEDAAGIATSAARIAGVNVDVATFLDKTGSAAERATIAGRASDLIVVDQPDAVMDSRANVLEQALFHSGRAVLVATSRRPPVRDVTKAAIAWDGGAHAARATGELMARFPGLKTVDVVVVQGEKDMSSALPGVELARHLARKGVDANVVNLPAGSEPVWKTIDAQAAASGADLLVMGGYGHTRFREFILGGVTEAMIRQASLPLLMAY